jgi:hypothetical protein
MPTFCSLRHCNDVPKRTTSKAEQQREYSENESQQAGNSSAAYMRAYRKRMRLEEDSCNNIHKRTRLNAERQSEYREAHKNRVVFNYEKGLIKNSCTYAYQE